MPCKCSCLLGGAACAVSLLSKDLSQLLVVYLLCTHAKRLHIVVDRYLLFSY